MKSPAPSAMLLAMVFALSACGQSGEDQSRPTVDKETSPETSIPDMKSPVDTAGKAPDAQKPDTSSSDDQAAKDDSVTPEGIRSAYTDLPPAESCTVTERVEEGASVSMRCAGRGNIPILLHEGDGRVDLDAGVKSRSWYSLGAFNSPGKTIEWRLGPDGKPFAFIYRLTTPKMGDIASTSALIVETVGQAGKPGCTIAEVAGSTANANAVAREKADAAFKGSPACLPE